MFQRLLQKIYLATYYLTYCLYFAVYLLSIYLYSDGILFWMQESGVHPYCWFADMATGRFPNRALGFSRVLCDLVQWHVILCHLKYVVPRVPKDVLGM